AEPLLRRSLAIKKKVEGDTSVGTLSTMRSLAQVLSERGDKAEANSLLKQIKETNKNAYAGQEAQAEPAPQVADEPKEEVKKGAEAQTEKTSEPAGVAGSEMKAQDTGEQHASLPEKHPAAAPL